MFGKEQRDCFPQLSLIYVVLGVAPSWFSEPNQIQESLCHHLPVFRGAQISTVKGSSFHDRTHSKCECFTFRKCICAGVSKICCHEPSRCSVLLFTSSCKDLFLIFMLLATFTFLWSLLIILVWFCWEWCLHLFCGHSPYYFCIIFQKKRKG